MHASMSSLLALVLALANVVLAQPETTGTASIMPFPPAVDGVQGQVIGTGADGTTYRIYGTYIGTEVPFTATLVQDASQLSEVAVLQTHGFTVTLQGSCSFSGILAVCEQEIIVPESTTSLSIDLPKFLTDVPILSGTEELGSTGESTASASGTVINTSGTGSGTTTVVSDAPSETTDADSGVERISYVKWALVLPILVSWFVW